MAEIYNIRTIEGQGRDTDRVDALREALVEAISEKGTGMSVAAVVGTLNILAQEIVTSWAEQDYGDGD